MLFYGIFAKFQQHFVTSFLLNPIGIFVILNENAKKNVLLG